MTEPRYLLIKAHGASTFADIYREAGQALEVLSSTGGSVMPEGKTERRTFAGFKLVIENPVGTVREGVDETGKPWRTEFQHAYGEIVGTLGVDGDPVDVYLGDDEAASEVYIVRQMKRKDWDKFDEDKCFLGFSSMEAAKQAYLNHYDDPRFFGGIIAMPIEEFRAKVRATKDKPEMLKALLLMKTQVSGYTKKDGTFVAPHQDKRGAAKKRDPAPKVRPTDTPEFKRWFGDSKVVDADGKPLVVYHGTASDISVFDISRSGESTNNTGFYGQGAYFTEDIEDATGYAAWAERGEGGRNLIPAYLSIRNPVYVHVNPKTEADKSRSRQSLQVLLDQLEKNGVFGTYPDPNEAGSLFGKLTKLLANAEFEKFMGTMYNSQGGGQAVTELAQKAGFDGVAVYSFKRDRNMLIEAVAFKPEQIKSAVGNRGTFDPSEADMTKAQGHTRMLFLKAHIAGHTRTLKSGKVVRVNAYDNKVVGRGKPAAAPGQAELFGGVQVEPEPDQAPISQAKPAKPDKDWRDEENWHSRTMGRMKTLDEASLRYVMKDATEAAENLERAGSTSKKAGQYRDEAHYASMELKSRRDAAAKKPAKASPKVQPKVKQIDTPAFKRWFGDSVMTVDGKAGSKPLVVYHGTSDDFASFDLNHPNRKDSGWLGTGVYVSDSSIMADAYAKMKDGGAAPNVMPLYAKLKKPYMASLEEKRKLMALGRQTSDNFTKVLMAEGYDGVILQYQDGREIVVFDPAGVKSAVGNNGNFDPNDPSLTKAMRIAAIRRIG